MPDSPSPDWDALREMQLEQWHPESQLSLPSTAVTRAAVPAIDVHNHLGRWLSEEGGWMIDDVDSLVSLMDSRAIDTIVNLDGRWGSELTENLDRYDRAHPGRFITFCQLDWDLLGRADGEPLLLESLHDSAVRGARGVKVWKNLGLSVRNADGSLVLPDDPRVIRVLTRAGELGLPVLIHVADPKAFFAPIDERNERLDELVRSQDWWFGDRSVHPAFDTLLDALAALVLATPGTLYIGAHVGCAAEELDRVEALMVAAPNFAVDIGGRMAEIGRQPRRFRALVERHPDRVLFGTDIYPASAEQFDLHFRFLETADEAFSYAPEEPVPPQGRWTVSGLELPLDLLEGVYSANARRILGLPAR